VPVEADLESHTSIFGRTSSGKTYLFREAIWKKTKKRIVFVNTQRELGFGPEISAHNWHISLLTKPAARVNLVPPLLSARANGQAATLDLCARIVDDCIAVGNKVARDRRGLVVLAFDEAHLLSPKGSPDDPLQRVATNGNRFGIKGAFITQRPAKLSHTVISQSMTKVLFDLDDYEQPYLDHYAVPQGVQEWIKAPVPNAPPGTPNRRFAVQQGKVWTRCRPYLT
jgi:hypothetical protein